MACAYVPIHRGEEECAFIIKGPACSLQESGCSFSVRADGDGQRGEGYHVLCASGMNHLGMMGMLAFQATQAASDVFLCACAARVCLLRSHVARGVVVLVFGVIDVDQARAGPWHMPYARHAQAMAAGHVQLFLLYAQDLTAAWC